MTILRNIGQLATCPAGNIQSDAGLIDNAAVILEEGKIAWAGPQNLMPVPARRQAEIDCRGALVVPGLVDCHTHLCFGGWRGDEFELRLRGASYQEIATAGGGIRSTVEATRSSDSSGLLARARQALDGMLELGVTTVECKSGYGLDLENEDKSRISCIVASAIGDFPMLEQQMFSWFAGKRRTISPFTVPRVSTSMAAGNIGRWAAISKRGPGTSKKNGFQEGDPPAGQRAPKYSIQQGGL